MHLALASLDPIWEDKASSMERCHELVALAANRGAELLAFPEMTLTGFTLNATSIAEPAHDSATIRAFSELGRAHRLALAFGVVLHGRERPTNTLVVVDRTGAELARYAKLHPFGPGGEDLHYERGEASPVAVVNDVAFGLSICYDIRFAELYAALSPRVHVLLVIASWPEDRIEHWRTLLQARAIENQCWVAGVNRTGVDGNGLNHPRSTYVFDPLGALVAPAWSEAELDGFEITAERTVALRRAFPVRRDRLPEVYRRIAAEA